MTEVRLGKLAPPNGERDAIHVAVVQVQAAVNLQAGQRVGLNANGQAQRFADEIIGIVDPFLTETVLKGEWFWMLMLPGTIDSLRHHWSHPAIDRQQEDDESWRDVVDLSDSCAGCW